MVSEISNHATILSNMATDIDASRWPNIRLRKIILRNFCKHEYLSVDFTDQNNVMPLTIFLGSNGIGKTTILNAVQYLFANFNSYEPDRLDTMLFRNVRNWQNLTGDEAKNSNFSIQGFFESDCKPFQYMVEVTRQGVISQHPENVRNHLTYCCMLTRFDQELTTFQIRRNQWELFQKLFSTVTGFDVLEDTSLFDQSSDKRTSRLLDQYVLGFRVRKPEETITNKQCSAGEKKIAKCFSTILNKSVVPSIILIDNVTDHIEQSRHLKVLSSIETCFPNSQLIVTCHSDPVQRIYPDRKRIMDLRLLHMPVLVQKEPWRLRAYDEVCNILERIQNATYLTNEEQLKLIGWARVYHGELMSNPNRPDLQDAIIKFLQTSVQELSGEWNLQNTAKITRLEPKSQICNDL